MKSFFMKIFLIIASGLCMFEGILLVAVGLGKLPPERLLSLYNRLLAAPKSLTTILIVGAFFVTLGFILLIVSSRTKPAPKMITVEKDGKALGIPQETIKNFIKQILEQNPHTSDVSVDFQSKKDCMDIRIAASFSVNGSVHQEVKRVEEILKHEIESVFEWKDYQFTFQVRGVGIDSQKKYFVSAKTQGVSLDAGEAVVGETEIIPEEESLRANDEVKGKDKPRDTRLLSKMLWGK